MLSKEKSVSEATPSGIQGNVAIVVKNRGLDRQTPPVRQKKMSAKPDVLCLATIKFFLSIVGYGIQVFTFGVLARPSLAKCAHNCPAGTRLYSTRVYAATPTYNLRHNVSIARSTDAAKPVD
jgi:hypothetical protein